MKKLLTILAIFISSYTFSQAKISPTGDVVPTGNYPVVIDKNIKGTLQGVNTIIERNSIPTNLRSLGMMAYVEDSSKTYQLQHGITNANWIELFGTTIQIGGVLPDSIFVTYPLHVDTIGGKRILSIYHDDGFIVKPIIIWSGFGLTYYATNGAYYINGKYYESPSTTITLSPADATYSTQYVFVSDTLGRTTFIRGIPASLPLLPADTIGYQLPITSGITIAAGATVPTTVFSTVYDEGIGETAEWTYADNGGVSAYTTNTANFFTGSHSTLVSTYTTNSRFYWYDNAYHPYNNNEVFNYHIWLNVPMVNSIYFSLFDGVGYATDRIRLGTAQGFNPQLTNQWQNISVSSSTFNWLSNKYNSVAFDMVGADAGGTGGFYLDYINIQTGNNLPSPGDWRTRISNDSLFQAINGTDTYIGAVRGSGSGTSGIDSTTTVKTLIGSDTANVTWNWKAGVGTPTKDTIWTHSGGGTETWEQTLANQGSTPFTTDNTVDFDGHDFSLSNTTTLSLSSIVGTQSGIHQMSPTYNQISNFGDSTEARIGTFNYNDNQTTGAEITVKNDNTNATHQILIYKDSILINGTNELSNPDTHLIINGLDSSNADPNNIAWFDNKNIVHRGYLPSSSGSGVTSVAKGYGLLADGTITSTGIITVDSAALHLKFLGLADSSLYTTLYQNSLKQNQLNGTGFVKATGTTISYDNSTYLTTIPNTAVTPGSYTNLNATIGADGRITAASNGSAGGSSATGVDSTNTAITAAQTVFTFPYTLTSYSILKKVERNGVSIDPSKYTVNTGNITFTGFTCDSGDKIRFIGIK